MGTYHRCCSDIQWYCTAYRCCGSGRTPAMTEPVVLIMQDKLKSRFVATSPRSAVSWRLSRPAPRSRGSDHGTLWEWSSTELCNGGCSITCALADLRSDVVHALLTFPGLRIEGLDSSSALVGPVLARRFLTWSDITVGSRVTAQAPCRPTPVAWSGRADGLG